MTWLEFKNEVLELLTVDKDRIGIDEFIEKQTRAACIDLMQYVERYRSGFKRFYFVSDFTREGFVSRGELPSAARVKEVSVFRTDDAAHYVAGTQYSENDLVQDDVSFRLYRAKQDTDIQPGLGVGWEDYWDLINTWSALAAAIENEVELSKHPATDAAWETRHLSMYKQLCVQDNNARVFISPYGNEFLLYPAVEDAVYAIDAESETFQFVLIEYSSDELDVEDGDEVAFDLPAAWAVADWIKGEICRHVDKDIPTYKSYLAHPGDGSRLGGSYFSKRSQLYLRAQELGRLGE